MEDQLASAMNLSLSRKLWLGMVAGALLVVVQYQIANSWLLALNSPPMVMQEPSLQAAVDQMQFDSRLVATVGERLLHDIARQVGYSRCSGISQLTDFDLFRRWNSF